MRVVGEPHVGAFQLAAAFDIDLGVAVDENVRDGRIGEQRLERPQAEHLVLDVADQASPARRRSEHRILGKQTRDEHGDLFLQPILGQALHHCEVDAVQQLLMDGHFQCLIRGVADAGFRPQHDDARPWD